MLEMSDLYNVDIDNDNNSPVDFNLYELDKGVFKIEVNCLGCSKENLKIKLYDTSLVISNHNEENDDEYKSYDRISFVYDKNFELKLDFDEKIISPSEYKNTLKNGILTVYVQIKQKEDDKFKEIDFE